MVVTSKHCHANKRTNNGKTKAIAVQGHLLELEMACGTKNAKEQLQEVQEVGARDKISFFVLCVFRRPLFSSRNRDHTRGFFSAFWFDMAGYSLHVRGLLRPSRNSSETYARPLRFKESPSLLCFCTYQLLWVKRSPKRVLQKLVLSSCERVEAFGCRSRTDQRKNMRIIPLFTS